MTVMLLMANEVIKFKHRAKLAGINGELVVTTLRLCWVPSIPKEAEAFESTWADVKNMVFSPPADPKVATKVDAASVPGGQTINSFIFFLDGSDKEKELLRLKAEYKKLRKTSPPTATTTSKTTTTTTSSSSSQAPAAGASSQKRRSPAQVLIDNHSESSVAAAHLVERKASLLQADHQLARSYKELVEVSQVISADEFWTLNVNLLEDADSTRQHQGRLTISDIIKYNSINNADGKSNITLNQDDRQSILESDATVRRAWNALVPVHKSETEFWIMYLEKHINGASAEADELFSRYEEQRDDGASSNSNNPNNPSGTTSSSNSSSSSRDFLNSLDLDFDLMKNYGDYHTSEQVASEDMLFMGRRETDVLNSESQRIMMPLRGNGASGAGLGAAAGAGAGAGRKRKSAALTTEFSELNQEKAPRYAPLVLRPRESAAIGEADKQETASGGGAFGKASSAVSRGVSRRAVAPLLSSRALVAALPATFPTTERAHTLYALDRTTLRTTSHAAAVPHRAWSEHLGAFRQEMLEAFVEVTGFLRHFFAVTGREGSGAPTPGSEAAVKVQKIVDRLLVRKEGLQVRARSIKDAKSIKDAQKYSEAEVEACCGIIGDITRLVTRAQDYWTLYQG